MTELLQQTPDKGEFPPLSPRKQLSHLIDAISDRTVEPEGDSPIVVAKEGYLRLSGARFLMTQILALNPLSSPSLRETAPASVLCLYVYNSTGAGCLESSVIMSGEIGGTVVGSIGDQELDNITPKQETALIQTVLTSISTNPLDQRILKKYL